MGFNSGFKGLTEFIYSYKQEKLGLLQGVSFYGKANECKGCALCIWGLLNEMPVAQIM